MPPKHLPFEPIHKPDPKLKLMLECTPDDLSHLFKAIANYQAYRDSDPDPVVNILHPMHPLIRLQTIIVGMLDELIATGLMHGWRITGLLEIKEAIAASAQANAEVEEELSGDDS